MVMITMMVRQRGHTLTKERGKEGMPCCKSVLKEILLDDDDEDMMMVTGQGTILTWKKVTFGSKWVVTTLRALLKSGLCATQLYIRSDTSSMGTRLEDALLQICIGNGDVEDDGYQTDDEARGEVLLKVSVIKIIIPKMLKRWK